MGRYTGTIQAGDARGLYLRVPRDHTSDPTLWDVQPAALARQPAPINKGALPQCLA
jgi:hypothetical protein